VTTHADMKAVGDAIRGCLGRNHGAASSLARECGVTPACISDVLNGHKAASPQLLARIASALNVDRELTDVWHAIAGHVAPDLVAVLVAHPERWTALRAMMTEMDRDDAVRRMVDDATMAVDP